jgi:hypothetical protein
MAPKIMKKTKGRKGGGIGDDLYDGAATFGRFMATVWLVIGTIIGLVLLGISLYLLLTPPKYSEHTTAKVIEAKCDRVSTGDSRGSANNCNMKIEYTVDDKKIVQDHSVFQSSTYYSVGSELKIRYNPDNPEDFTTAVSRKTVGWILLAIGLVVMVISWVSWWIVTSFKFASASMGAATAYDMVRY